MAATKQSASLLAKLKQHKAEIVAALRLESAARNTLVPPEPDVVEIKERAAMAAVGVPGPYLDAWARLQCQRPFGASGEEWWQVIDAAGRFLDQWGSRAVELAGRQAIFSTCRTIPANAAWPGSSTASPRGASSRMAPSWKAAVSSTSLHMTHGATPARKAIADERAATPP